MNTSMIQLDTKTQIEFARAFAHQAGEQWFVVERDARFIELFNRGEYAAAEIASFLILEEFNDTSKDAPRAPRPLSEAEIKAEAKYKAWEAKQEAHKARQRAANVNRRAVRTKLIPTPLS